MLDGAWGVLIHRHGLSEADYRGELLRDHGRDVRGDPDILNLTRPSLISETHDAYFAAGADIATTNTFTATSIGQGDYDLGHLAPDMSREGARLARTAADAWSERTPDRPRFVAGAVGPLNVSLSVSPKVDDPLLPLMTFDEVRTSYAEQIAALVDGGVDLLLVETDLRHAQREGGHLRHRARRRAGACRSWLSFTIDRPERAHAIGADGRSVLDLGLARPSARSSGSTARSARARCGRTSRSSRRVAPPTSAATRTPACRTLSASTTRRPRIRPLLRDVRGRRLVNIVGGCCGTTPDHIRADRRGGEGLRRARVSARA